MDESAIFVLMKTTKSKSLNILFLCSWYPNKLFPSNGDFIMRHAEAVALKNRVSVLHILTDPLAKKDSLSVSCPNGIDTYIVYLKPRNTLVNTKPI